MQQALLSLPVKEGKRRPWLILVGESITDGNPRDALLAANNAGWPSVRSAAFLGRNEADFLRLFDAIQSSGSIADLPSVAVVDEFGAYALAEGQHLPERAEHFCFNFSPTMKAEISLRGPRVLLDGLTRGCEHRCLYCHLNNRAETSGVVQDLGLSPAACLLEMSAWCGQDTLIQFTDENFFGGRSKEGKRVRLRSIEALGRELLDQGFKGALGVDTRVDTVIYATDDASTRELRSNAWQLLAEAGLRYAYLGTESFSPSQLKRYGKAGQLTHIQDSLHFLGSLNVSYMLGLILLDPLVQPSELAVSIEFIESNKLSGSVGSLLKEMRIQNQSRFYHLLSGAVDEINLAARDSLMLNRASVPYVNDKIRSILLVTRPVHELFAESGYRHSDVAAFESLLPELGTVPGYSIPRVVTDFELGLLKTLLTGEGPGDLASALERADACAKDVLDLVSKRRVAVNTPAGEKVHRYYETVFARIRLDIAECFERGMPRSRKG